MQGIEFVYDKKGRNFCHLKNLIPSIKNPLPFNKEQLLQCVNTDKPLQKILPLNSKKYLLYAFPTDPEHIKGILVALDFSLLGNLEMSPLLENLEDVIVLIDRRGRIICANKALKKFIPSRIKNFENKNILDILPLKEKLKISTFKKILRDFKPQVISLRSYDNRVYIFEIRLFPIPKENKIKGFLIWAKDITSYHKEKEEIKNKLLGLMNISQKVISNKNLDDLLQDIVKRACVLCKAPFGILRLLDEEGKLRIQAYKGLSFQFINLARTLNIGEGISGIAGMRKKPFGVSNIQKNKNVKFKEALLKEGVISALSVPVLFQGRLLGVIGVADRKSRKFTKSEITFLKSFASQVAVSINSIQQKDLINESYFNTLNALVLTMEARDPYTRGHSERVTRFALSIGKKLGLDEDNLRTLRFGTLVHDIGKIAISESILLKPSPLTLTEWAQIQLHPEKGEEMLRPLRFLNEALKIVRHHHERFDGKGYPDGLKEEKIPFLARIVSVADAFDAMTSDRPYRKRFDLDYAVREIKKHRATQFDPQAVEAFLKMM